MKETRKSGAETGLEALGLLSQLGLTLTLPIIAGAFAGHWLDGKLGTGVVFFILLVCLGIAGGTLGAYRQITFVTKRRNR